VALMALNVQMFTTSLGAFKPLAPNVIIDKAAKSYAYKHAFREKYKPIY